jgi:hypothetical protein
LRKRLAAARLVFNSGMIINSWFVWPVRRQAMRLEAAGERVSAARAAPARYFFFGANNMTICLPSMIGFCSMML